MNSNHSPVTILLVGDPIASSLNLPELEEQLSDSFAAVVSFDSVAAAEDWLRDAGSRADSVLLVCDWHAKESLTLGSSQSTAAVFFSDNQAASVRFVNWSNDFYYCLKTNTCAEVLPLIASLALRMKDTQPSGAEVPRVEQSHFVLPFETTSGLLASNIHSLY